MTSQSDDRLCELVLYLVSCARLALDEPPIYGSFRLVEAASRLINRFGPSALPSGQPLEHVRDAIEQNKLLMIDEPGAYRAWLDELLQQLTAEAMRRNRAGRRGPAV